MRSCLRFSAGTCSCEAPWHATTARAHPTFTEYSGNGRPPAPCRVLKSPNLLVDGEWHGKVSHGGCTPPLATCPRLLLHASAVCCVLPSTLLANPVHAVCRTACLSTPPYPRKASHLPQLLKLCQVTDFGLSRCLEECAEAGGAGSSSLAATNPRWLAPELLVGKPATLATGG